MTRAAAESGHTRLMMKRLQNAPSSSAGSGASGSLLGVGAGALLGRAVAVAAAGVILLAGLFVSAVVFSVLLVVGLVAAGWFWWKTRDLRRNLRERMAQMQRTQPGATHGPQPGDGAGLRRTAGPGSGRAGDVLDGDFIRETGEPGR
jgi:hypothetical protein